MVCDSATLDVGPTAAVRLVFANVICIRSTGAARRRSLHRLAPPPPPAAVAADDAPSFAEGVDDQAYTQGEEIATLQLPAASGGDGDLTYTLDPDVPGLEFDAAELTLSGAPTDLGVSELTYTVTDDKW